MTYQIERRPIGGFNATWEMVAVSDHFGNRQPFTAETREEAEQSIAHRLSLRGEIRGGLHEEFLVHEWRPPLAEFRIVEKE